MRDEKNVRKRPASDASHGSTVVRDELGHFESIRRPNNGPGISLILDF